MAHACTLVSYFSAQNITENEEWVTKELDASVSLAQLHIGVGSTNIIYDKWHYNWSEGDLASFVEWAESKQVRHLDLWRTDIDVLNATNGTAVWDYTAIEGFLESY